MTGINTLYNKNKVNVFVAFICHIAGLERGCNFLNLKSDKNYDFRCFSISLAK